MKRTNRQLLERTFKPNDTFGGTYFYRSYAGHDRRHHSPHQVTFPALVLYSQDASFSNAGGYLSPNVEVNLRRYFKKLLSHHGIPAQALYGV